MLAQTLILPPDNLVIVDGSGMRLDLSQIGDGITRIEWDGSSGGVFRGRSITAINDFSPYQWVLDAYQAELDARVARAADPFRGMAPSLAISVAAKRKLEAVAVEMETRITSNIAVGRKTYYADSWATKTLESALTVSVALGLADDAPVRVPYPLQPGYWLTADLDATGNRIASPMTIGGLKAIVVALYDRNGTVWGQAMIHQATIGAMIAGGATARQIMAYDTTQGWGE